ncbi:MAG: aminotransferase class V-fold PLP-dependent enzyme [Lachnospiraceae bacterium]|nr:aminotransferase class V-fold PLP-dependent enzyme [Lachnospiraceae bacterium]
MIYLDNAATTLHKPKEVTAAVVKAMTQMGNSARGAHKGTLTAGRIIYDTREKLCRLFHGPGPENIVFTLNSTEALNMAINGLIHPKDHVISTDLEHNSVLRPLYRLNKEQEVELSFVAADKTGCMDYNDFEKLIRPETTAIVCTHGSNLTGNLVDIKKVGRIAKEHNLLFIVDASQTAGVFPIDMESMNIDVLCFTGHKSLYGPQGTGGMCISKDVIIRPMKVGGSGIKTYEKEHPADLPVRLEAGTLNGHGIAGLGAGVDFILRTSMDQIREKEQALSKRFYEGIYPLSNVTIYGDYSTNNRAPIVAFNIGDYDSAQVSDELAEVYDIASRPGGHCAPRMHEALGTKEQGAVRFSFSWFNTEEEVDQAMKAVSSIALEG